MRSIVVDACRSVRSFAYRSQIPSVGFEDFVALIPYTAAFAYFISFVSSHSDPFYNTFEWFTPLFIVSAIVVGALSIQAYKVGIWILYSRSEELTNVIGRVASYRWTIGLMACVSLVSVATTCAVFALFAARLVLPVLVKGLGHWS